MELEWQMENNLFVNDGTLQMQQMHYNNGSFIQQQSHRSYIQKTEVDFHCWIDPQECKTVNQKYSKKLNKLFAVPEKVLRVNFSFIDNHPGMIYFIRAQPTYSLDACIKEPVTRCPGHAFEDTDDTMRQHVLRCETGEPHYEQIDGKYSVRVALQHYNPSKVSLKYKFVCKTSCNGGINNRPTHILFTLEDERADILGTCRLEVRISSAPNRDMCKEESSKESGKVLAKKRKLPMSREESIGAIKETYAYLENNLAAKGDFLGWLYRCLTAEAEGPEEERLIMEGLQSLSRLRSSR